MSKRIKISYDENNFNLHTDEGMELLEKSIRKVGVIESITISSDEKIISGNARHEKISEVLGDAEPIIVETDGTKPIILKRTDIKRGNLVKYKVKKDGKFNVNIDKNELKRLLKGNDG
ncbi:MAG: hypothetical protein FWF52_01225 [Candidatus Azobacteroides sp.]|nr:hypothetical protein [Candidatus Azobacteroides sp.]